MIVYKSGDPDRVGVYACRFIADVGEQDQFLEWDGAHWRWARNYVPLQEQGRVVGWIGPLQRKLGELPAEASLVVTPTELDETIREFTRRAMLAAFEKAGWDDVAEDARLRYCEDRPSVGDRDRLAQFAINIMAFGFDE